VIPESIAAVEDIMKENRRVTVNEIAAPLDTSHGSAHRIVRDFLQFHKRLTHSLPAI
jgi:predicted transcriptional regulator